MLAEEDGQRDRVTYRGSGGLPPLGGSESRVGPLLKFELEIRCTPKRGRGPAGSELSSAEERLETVHVKN